jgi:hypothetical protein
MSRELSKYFWPSSGLRPSVEMDLLYRARESSTPRIPITQLIARAVRETYGHLAEQECLVIETEEPLEVAA